MSLHHESVRRGLYFACGERFVQLGSQSSEILHDATRRGSQPRHRASPPPLTPQAPSRRLRRLPTTGLWLVLGFERSEDVAGTAPRTHQLGIIAEPIPHHPVARAPLLLDLARRVLGI